MKNTAEIVWGAGAAAALIAAMVAGCAGSKTTTTDAAPAKTAGAASEDKTIELSGAQLWSENCALCHNSRPPTDYSDLQWDVAVFHMRVQARLTGGEERKIRQFLQASN